MSDPHEVTPTEARQGRPIPMMRRILFISLALAVAALATLAAIWFF